jgi:hypothetical protein
MFEQAGVLPSAAAVAARYAGLLTHYVMEPGDDATGIEATIIHAPTLMRGLEDKIALARVVPRCHMIWAVLPVKELEGAKQAPLARAGAGAARGVDAGS